MASSVLSYEIIKLLNYLLSFKAADSLHLFSERKKFYGDSPLENSATWNPIKTFTASVAAN